MNIEAVLLSWGLEVKRAGDLEIVCLCPLHPDSHASFSVNRLTGLWYCYAGCGGGNIAQLAGRLGRDVMVAAPTAAYLRSQLNKLHFATTNLQSGGDLLWPYRTGELPEWFLERGFTWEVAAKWVVGVSHYCDALAIPVEEPLDGAAVALIYRHRPGVEPKYEYTPGFPMSRTLFGLHRLDRDWIRQRSLILVEGPLDCMRLHQYGYFGALSVLGGGLSLAQAKLVKSLARSVCLAFDNDDAGRSFDADARKKLKGLPVWSVDWSRVQRKDPGECDEVDLQRLQLDTLAGGVL